MLGQFKHWSLDESVAFRQETDENAMEDGDDPNPKRYTYQLDHRQNILGGQLFVKKLENSDNEVRKEYQELELQAEAAWEERKLPQPRPGRLSKKAGKNDWLIF